MNISMNRTDVSPILLGRAISVSYDPTLLVAPVSDYLCCDICFNLMAKPLQCPLCGNSFCSACISEVLSETKEECPTCCRPLTPSQLVVNRALSGAISDLSIRCPTTLDSATSGEGDGVGRNNSTVVNSSVPIVRCQWEGYIKNVEEHLETCLHMFPRAHFHEEVTSTGLTEGVIAEVEAEVETSCVPLESQIAECEYDAEHNEHVIPNDCREITDISLSERKDSPTRSASSDCPEHTALSTDFKMQLYIFVDVLMESCSYEVLELSTRQLRHIVGHMMDVNSTLAHSLNYSRVKDEINDSASSGAACMLVSDISDVVVMFDSLLVLIADTISAEPSSIEDENSSSNSTCLQHWEELVKAVMDVEVVCLSELVQQLLEVCANFSDVVNSMLSKKMRIDKHIPVNNCPVSAPCSTCDDDPKESHSFSYSDMELLAKPALTSVSSLSESSTVSRTSPLSDEPSSTIDTSFPIPPPMSPTPPPLPPPTILPVPLPCPMLVSKDVSSPIALREEDGAVLLGNNEKNDENESVELVGGEEECADSGNGEDKAFVCSVVSHDTKEVTLTVGDLSNRLDMSLEDTSYLLWEIDGDSFGLAEMPNRMEVRYLFMKKW